MADQIRIGTRLPAKWDRDGEWHPAEVLELRQVGGETKYYIHFDNFNHRLDTWMSIASLDPTKIMRMPPPKKDDHGTPAKAAPAAKAETPKEEKKGRGGATGRKRRRSEATPATKATPVPESPAPDATPLPPLKRAKTEPNKAEEKDAEEKADGDEPPKVEGGEEKKEGEEEMGPQASGAVSAAHKDHPQVRNVLTVVLGKHDMDAWYFSPYPEDATTSMRLYLCEFCLTYLKSEKQLIRHKLKCNLRHPPGNEIYRKDNYSFFEIDGKKNWIYCQNLCLLSKLFLDHKTLYFDTEPFLFYILCEVDQYGCHLVGYFSKLKDNSENNVACILTLPSQQRKGFGKVLIAFSYALSRKEGRLGTPERPLSDLGLLSYRSYWSDVLINILNKTEGTMSIKKLSLKTGMKTDDIIATLHLLEIIKYSKGQYVLCLTPDVLERHKPKPTDTLIDESALHWTPFTANAKGR